MDRNKRPARLLGLVCLLPLAVTGCRTIVPTKPAASPSAPPTLEDAARPSQPNEHTASIVKTDFHRKTTTDQQFNVHLELGKQQMRDGQFEMALSEFKKALDACSHASGLRTGSHRIEQQATAHRKIGAALAGLDKFPEAEEHLKQAAKLAPNDPRVWNDLGYTYSTVGRWADAERALRRAAKLDPESPLVKTNLGFAVASDGRAAEALEHLSASSGKAVGHANLGFALARQNRLVEARDEYRKALELQPQLTKAHDALARLDNPKTNAPLGQAPAAGAPRVGSAVPDVKAVAVATPGPNTLPQPNAVYQASATPPLAPLPTSTEQPRDTGVSEVQLVPQPTARTTEASPAPANVDSALHPTSYTEVAAVPAVSATPIPPPIPPPVPPPVPAAARTVQSKPVPALAAARSVPSSSRASRSTSIPMPVPAPAKPASTPTTRTGASIPMPVPFAQHLAAPVVERDRNPTSAPATDARLRSLPPSND